MYNQIKKLADEALALQNKDRMDAVLREISAMCAPSAANLTLAERVAAQVPGSVLVTYGEAKSYDSEAEMIADIQGAPSPVFPLPGAADGKSVSNEKPLWPGASAAILKASGLGDPDATVSAMAAAATSSTIGEVKAAKAAKAARGGAK